MLLDHWTRIKAVFEEAHQCAPEDRSAYLDTACSGDTAFRAEIERLLAADDEASAYFDTLGGALHPEEVPMSIPESVGPWRTTRELGVGGMGQVIEAVRDDGHYDQRVALKLVRPGLAPALIDRFRAERRLLAGLEHPGIARLLDGGVAADGRPYFAMEYIEGEPLFAYADAARLGVEDRLCLFLGVCEAVAYAHGQLIVHRDLKPNNILVTPDGTPKLLDFGIAKLLDEEGEGLTRTGHALMTPEYAAPEQINDGPISTATDVYALGVLLYELLTGRRPYVLNERGAQAVAHAVCEQKPLRPSARVRLSEEQRSVRGETRTVTPEEVARRRATSPDRLRRRLSDDLDTVTLKALRKEPERRYASVEALATDVRRHLDGLPVLARPDTMGYRMRKFARRHRAGVAATALAFIALVGGLGVALWQARAARVEANRAQTVATFMTEMLQDFNPSYSQGGTLTAEAVLGKAVERVDEQLNGQPGVRAQLYEQLGTIYQSYGRFDEAEHLLSTALEIKRGLYGERHTEVAKSIHSLAWYWHVRGDYEQAEALYVEAQGILRTLGQEEDLVSASNLEGLGLIARVRGDAETSERVLRRALAIRREVLAPMHPDVGTSLNMLAYVLTIKKEYDEADRLYQEALAIQRAAFGLHVQTAQALHDYASLSLAQEDYPKAESLYQEALSMRRSLLGSSHPHVAQSLSHLGWLYQHQGRYADAQPLYEEALSVRQEHFGSEHLSVANSLLMLGEVLCYQGEVTEGLETQQRAVALYERVLRPSHLSTALAKLRLGRSFTDAGRYDEAEAVLRESRAAIRSELGADHARTREVEEVLSALEAARRERF